MAKFGLVGKNIDYSFSRAYFSKKFEEEGLEHTYENFDFQSIDQLKEILENTKELKGLNVTIPYKELVIPYLDKLNKTAKKIGAVNTIKITKKGEYFGYNTDYYGFKKSLEPYLKPHHKKALIFGTGGASKAIAYALEKLGIKYNFVSRNSKNTTYLTYDNLTSDTIKSNLILVNSTPLGTYPNTNECLDIPYEAINDDHILFDLIYNPAESKFLNLGKQNGAQTINGENMLKFQADKAWKIWHS